MKNRFIYLLLILCMGAWSAPNVDKFAQIFGRDIDINEENVSGYIDAEGKLWIVAKKWHTEKVIAGAYVPDGKTPLKYSDMPTVPYQYFWLYDKNGQKIREGAIGDSIELITLIPIENGGALIVPRIRTDIGVRIADPTSGYLNLILLDKNGNNTQIHKLLQPQYENSFLYKLVIDYEGTIYLALTKSGLLSNIKVHLDNGKMYFAENVELRWPLTRGVMEFFTNNIPLICTHVDTVIPVGERGDLLTEPTEHVLFKDKIDVHYYDPALQKWQRERYHIPTVSFRKFEIFDLYPLQSYPKIKNIPEYQSVRLNNGNIVITVFMIENQKPVAYQMLFDSLGRYIVPEKIEILKTKDVRKIPDRSKMFIKRLPVRDSWDKGGYRAADVYIWGYDTEDGMLYWKKYLISG